MPVALAPTGLTGMQHADGEILAARGGRRVRHPVHALDHEHLLDRGRGGEDQEAVLVPALRDARPRLHRAPDRSRQGGELLGAGADARPADPRPAPQGPEERPVGAAETDASQHHQHRRPSRAGAWACWAPSAAPSATSSGHVARASRTWPRLSWTAEQFDPTLKWDDVNGQGALGRQADPQGHHGRRGCAAGRRHRRRRAHRVQPRRPPARRRAVLDRGAAAIGEAVGNKIEVQMDGGIRSGQDVLKALALGAKGA